MQHKITVVGAGNVGATAAQRVVEKELADVVIVDIPGECPRQGPGSAEAPHRKTRRRDAGANDYEAPRIRSGDHHRGIPASRA